MKNAAVINNDDFHATMEYAWKVSFLSLMRPAIRDELVLDGACSFSRELPGFLRDNWGSLSDCTIIDPFRLGWLLDLLFTVQSTEGDIVECGAFRGGSSILMALALQKLSVNKVIHVFDSFQGLPDPHINKDKGYKRGQFKADYDACITRIRDLGLEHIIRVHKGWFADTIKDFLASSPTKISLLHIDCDLYTSTKDCFSLFYPFVSPSGVVVLDDFNDGGRGEKTAVLELMIGHRELFHVGPAPQCFFRKGEYCKSQGSIFTDGGFDYDLAKLFQDTDYITWLNKLLQGNYRDYFNRFLSK